MFRSCPFDGPQGTDRASVREVARERARTDEGLVRGEGEAPPGPRSHGRSFQPERDAVLDAPTTARHTDAEVDGRAAQAELDVSHDPGIERPRRREEGPRSAGNVDTLWILAFEQREPWRPRLGCLGRPVSRERRQRAARRHGAGERNEEPSLWFSHANTIFTRTASFTSPRATRRGGCARGRRGRAGRRAGRRRTAAS